MTQENEIAVVTDRPSLGERAVDLVIDAAVNFGTGVGKGYLEQRRTMLNPAPVERERSIGHQVGFLVGREVLVFRRMQQRKGALIGAGMSEVRAGLKKHLPDSVKGSVTARLQRAAHGRKAA